jgi:hypothetical protein
VAQRVRLQRVLVAPLHLHVEAAQQLEHRLHVADARNAAQHDLLAGQKRRSERWQSGILVAGGNHRPR